MRKLLTILFTLFSLAVFGQNDNIEISTDSNCYSIDYEVDDFTGESRYSTTTSDINIIRVFTEDKEDNYLSLHSYGQKAITFEKGVILLFSDKSRLEFPSEEVDCDISDYGYQYNSFFRITEEQIEALTSKTVDKWRLYVFDNDISDSDAEEFRIQAECISSCKYDTFLGKTLRLSSIKAVGVSIYSSGRQRETTRADRVDMIKVCFNVLVNPIADSGEKNLFLRIFDADSTILESPDASNYSAKRAIQYANDRLPACIFFSCDLASGNLTSGLYSIEVLEDDVVIGVTKLVLR